MLWAVVGGRSGVVFSVIAWEITWKAYKVLGWWVLACKRWTVACERVVKEWKILSAGISESNESVGCLSVYIFIHLFIGLFIHLVIYLFTYFEEAVHTVFQTCLKRKDSDKKLCTVYLLRLTHHTSTMNKHTTVQWWNTTVRWTNTQQHNEQTHTSTMNKHNSTMNKHNSTMNKHNSTVAGSAPRLPGGQGCMTWRQMSKRKALLTNNK